MYERKVLFEVISQIFQDNQSIDKSYVEFIEHDAMIEEIKKEKLMPYLYNNDVVLRVFPEKIVTTLNKMHDENVNRLTLMYNELKEILLFASENNIKIILIKGFCISNQIFDNPFNRVFYDMDLIVEDKDIPTMIKYFKENGYHQFTMNYSTNEIEEIEQDEIKWFSWFHEYQYEKKVEDCTLYLEVKKTSSALDGSVMKKFSEHLEKMKIEELEVLTLDLTHSFLHLISNTYRECINTTNSAKVLRNIIDIMWFIKKYVKGEEDNLFAINNVRVQDILLLSKEYGLQDDLYFVMRLLKMIFPNNVILGYICGQINGFSNDKLDYLLSIIRTNSLDYYFNKENRVRIAKNYWRNYIFCNQHSERICSSPMKKFALDTEEGSIYGDIYKENEVINFQFTIPNYRKHMGKNRIVLNLIDGFINNEIFIHRIYAWINCELTGVACVTYDMQQSFEKEVQINQDEMIMTIKITRARYEDIISNNNKMAYNILIEREIRKGIDIGISALLEVSSSEHNLEKIAVVTL